LLCDRDREDKLLRRVAVFRGIDDRPMPRKTSVVMWGSESSPEDSLHRAAVRMDGASMVACLCWGGEKETC
jgi:hypothetical protein